jgi:hypothetical protein
MKGNEVTFRREGSDRIYESCIDHVISSEINSVGVRTVDHGHDASDHSIILGWVEIDVPVERIKEMKKGTLPTIRPSDKGATRRLEKAINRISSEA